MNLTEISGIVGGRLIGEGRRDIQDLLIDSRQLVSVEKTLFFALVSDRNDGHKYVGDLYQDGVRAFVVNHVPQGEMPEASFIVVDDTLKALQCLAAYHRAQYHIPVIGITGSNGKTIVKEWLAQLLGPDYHLVRSPKSYNSQVGVPLSVWQMNVTHQLGIFEAGISQPDEMNILQKIIKPTIGVFTNIGQAHEENFISYVQKAGEKLNLFTQAETLVYCMDYYDIQQVIMRSELGKKVHLLSWSRKFKEAEVFVNEVEKEEKQTRISLTYQGVLSHFTIPFTDDASIENAIHSIVVCLLLKMEPAKLADRLQELTSIAMRLEIKAGINNCTIINDYYNSDVNSLVIALDVMNQQRQHKEKVLLLSDILQSGRNENEL